MIAFVQGHLEALEENSVIIENNGMGYRIFTPIQEELLRVGIGNPIRLYTYLNVREDAMVLYGFLHRDTLELFRQLINVNGVGPKYALAILTSMRAEEVLLAIAAEDAKALSKVPGIGPKTAARIILDLKDKIQKTAFADENEMPSAGPAVSAESSAVSEAMMALMALGYTQSEAAGVVRKVTEPGMSAEQIIKLSLKQMI